MNRIAAFILLALACCGTASADERPPFFSFLLGMSGSHLTEDARSLGVNTLYLQVPSDPDKLGPVKVRIREAHEAGLRVIAALPTLPGDMTQVCTDNSAYVLWVTERLGSVLKELAPEAGVTVWATSDFLETDIRYTAAGFQKYLRGVYPSLAVLNDAWGAAYPTWAQIGIQDALDADNKLPFSVGRPSVDFADFQRQEYHDVMKLWADIIRKADPDRPLMTGRVSLYRSLSAIPDAYRIIQVWMPPDVLEPDTASSNVQAIDMARRGGKFDVLPVFRMPLPPSPLYSAAALRTWVSIAALHGACGFGVEDAKRIDESGVPDEARRQLNSIFAQARPADFGIQPRGGAAILWEPYAQGFGVGPEKAPVYGFIQGFSDGEPNNLFGALRLGTVFGTVDVLQLEDIPDADLDRYSVIITPLALKLTTAAAQAIGGYVERGGTLLSDIGLGMYNSGGWGAIPFPASGWFGIEGLIDVRDRAGRLSFNRTMPWFPSVKFAARALGLPQESQNQPGTGAPTEKWCVFGPAGYALITPDTVPVAVSSIARGPKGEPEWMGIFARERGVGLALFGTYRIWSNWDWNDPAYIGFHRDLLAHGAAYQLIGADLYPGQVLSTRVGEDGLRLLNRGGNAAVAEAFSYVAGSRPYLGAWSRFAADSRTDAGLRTGYARLSALLGPGEFGNLQAIPLQVEPYEGTATVWVDGYDSKHIAFQVAGDGSTLRLNAGQLKVTPSVVSQSRITVKDGEYAVKPLSRHLVRLRLSSTSADSRIFEADANGQFRFDVQGRWVSIEVTLAP